MNFFYMNLFIYLIYTRFCSRGMHKNCTSKNEKDDINEIIPPKLNTCNTECMTLKHTLYFFIAAQIIQSIWIAQAGQLRQTGQQ